MGSSTAILILRCSGLAPLQYEDACYEVKKPIFRNALIKLNFI